MSPLAAALVVALSLAATPHDEDRDVPRLRPGRWVEGEVRVDSQVVATPQAPALRGVRFEVLASDRVRVTLELRSAFFDAYLAVFDASGTCVGENDDGGLSTHSRLVLDLEPGRYDVWACARPGGSGPFRIFLRRGVRPDPAPARRTAVEIRDAQWVATERGRLFADDDPRMREALDRLANLLSVAGRYAEAEPVRRRLLAASRRAFGVKSPETARQAHNLALLLLSCGRAREARSLLEQALSVFEQRLGPDHAAVAACVSNLARACEAEGDFEEAERLVRRALDVRSRTLPDDHLLRARAENNVGRVLFEQGRYEEAEERYFAALAILEGRDREDELGDRAIVLEGLAEVFEAEGKLPAAARRAEESLRLRRLAQGAAHPETLANEERCIRLEHLLGRHDDALRHALTLCDVGAGYVERESGFSAPADRLRVAHGQRGRVDLLLDIVLQTPAHERAAAVAEAYRRVAAAEGVVYRRARVVGHRLAQCAEADPDLAERRDELLAATAALARLVHAPGDEGGLERLEADLRVGLARRRSLEQEVLLSLSPPRRHAAVDGAEFARLLPEDSALLDFVLHTPGRSRGETLPTRLLCFVLRPGDPSPHLLDLGEAEPLRRLLRRALAALVPTLRGRPMPSDDVLVAWRDRLWTPLAPGLVGVRRLFVIPDGFLGEWPFEAFSFEDGRCLLDAVEVVYAEDPVTLRDRLASPPRPRAGVPRLLLVGGVAYGRPGAGRRWTPLPGTHDEIEAVAALHRRCFGTEEEADGDPAVVALVGAQATEDTLAARVPGVDYLHLATHGFFERSGLAGLWSRLFYEPPAPAGLGAAGVPSSRPPRVLEPVSDPDEVADLLCGLVLAGANAPPDRGPRDGILTAAEVAGLDLRGCRLVVLSACETALGAEHAGEGMLSLRRAFLEAGADAAVATLWRVEDEATRRLMADFYEGVFAGGLGPAAALRRAQLRLRRDLRFQNPRHWAAFTLAGEWR